MMRPGERDIIPFPCENAALSREDIPATCCGGPEVPVGGLSRARVPVTKDAFPAHAVPEIDLADFVGPANQAFRNDSGNGCRDVVRGTAGQDRSMCYIRLTLAEGIVSGRLRSNLRNL